MKIISAVSVLVFSTCVFAQANDLPIFAQANPRGYLPAPPAQQTVVTLCDPNVDATQAIRPLKREELRVYAYDCEGKAIALVKDLDLIERYCRTQTDRGGCHKIYLLKTFERAVYLKYAEQANTKLEEEE